MVKLDRGSQKTKALYVKSIVVTYETAAVVPVDATAIELDKTTLTIVEGKTETLNATLTPANATTAVTWESSNESVATVTAAGKVTAVAVGTATITAKAGELSATCAVTVNEAPDPTNCAEAAEAALSVSGDNVEYKNGKEYTIRGYVTEIQTAYNSQYNNITFWMADTENGGKVLEAFRAACASEADAPEVGDLVDVTGKLTKYNSTPEFAAGCTFVIIGAPAVPSVEADLEKIELSADAAATQKIALTYENWGEAVPTVIAATEAAWITNLALNNDNSELTFDVAANEGAERSATITITATANETVATATITVSQAKYKKPVEPILPIEGEHNYVKVTATEDITTGCYLIVYEGSTTIAPVAFDGSKTTLDAANNGVAVEIKEGKIASSEAVDAAYFAIDAENGTILSASGKYIGVSSNSNGLGSSDDAETYTHTFTIDENGNAIIAAVFEGSTMALRYNYASNQARFRYYNKSGQQAVALYKQVASGSTTALDNTAVEAKAVKSLQNGMLIIEKAGVRYNVMGQVIR